MTAQTVLSNKQSTYGGPYGFYTVTLTPSNRTMNSVTVKVKVTAHLQYDASYTEYGVKCSLYIGGAWHEFTLVAYGTAWQGTSPISATKTITVSGLSVAQTVIDGIKFKATAGDGETSGPSLKATGCSDLVIDLYGGFAHLNVDGAWTQALLWLNVNGTWRLVLPWVRGVGAWRSIDKVIPADDPLVTIVNDGNGNAKITFAPPATVEQSGGNVKIVASCIGQDANGNVTIP